MTTVLPLTYLDERILAPILDEVFGEGTWKAEVRPSQPGEVAYTSPLLLTCRLVTKRTEFYYIQARRCLTEARNGHIFSEGASRDLASC